VGQGINTVQAELFPDISIGDAPSTTEAPGAPGTPVAAAPPAAAAGKGGHS
jgi:hypothetical protein